VVGRPSCPPRRRSQPGRVADIHDDEAAAAALGVLRRAAAWFAARGVTVERLLSGNAGPADRPLARGLRRAGHQPQAGPALPAADRSRGCRRASPDGLTVDQPARLVLCRRMVDHPRKPRLSPAPGESGVTGACQGSRRSSVRCPHPTRHNRGPEEQKMTQSTVAPVGGIVTVASTPTATSTSPSPWINSAGVLASPRCPPHRRATGSSSPGRRSSAGSTPSASRARQRITHRQRMLLRDLLEAHRITTTDDPSRRRPLTLTEARRVQRP
jgi:hypothetical protein